MGTVFHGLTKKRKTDDSPDYYDDIVDVVEDEMSRENKDDDGNVRPVVGIINVATKTALDILHKRIVAREPLRNLTIYEVSAESKISPESLAEDRQNGRNHVIIGIKDCVETGITILGLTFLINLNQAVTVTERNVVPDQKLEDLLYFSRHGKNSTSKKNKPNADTKIIISDRQRKLGKA